MLEDPGKELPFNGVFRISADGDLTLLLDSVVPNGIGFSPDETILYVTDGGPDRNRWLAFPLGEAGPMGGGLVLFDATDLPGLGGPTISSSTRLATSSPPASNACSSSPRRERTWVRYFPAR
jgi:gluconolactonase